MKIVVSVVVAAFLVALLGIGFVYSGFYNVAANVPHTKAMEWVLETTRDRAVEVRTSRIKVPNLKNTEMIAEGVTHYREMCVVCHGAPGVEPSGMSVGLNPAPPLLAESARDTPPQEIFWIARNGLKMTGMPAFSSTFTDDKIWDIVAIVEQLPNLSAADYDALVKKSSESR